MSEEALISLFRKFQLNHLMAHRGQVSFGDGCFIPILRIEIIPELEELFVAPAFFLRGYQV